MQNILARDDIREKNNRYKEVGRPLEQTRRVEHLFAPEALLLKHHRLILGLQHCQHYVLKTDATHILSNHLSHE